MVGRNAEENKSFCILIVDDVDKNIQLVANCLKTEGYSMSYAQSGERALEMVKAQDFDLILLDVMMPGLDGFEVCHQLKADPETALVPVVFLTAKTDNASLVQAFEMGAVDFVTKPFNAKELRLRVRTHLNLKRTRERLTQTNQLKDKFFSIIAHDLKSPVSSLLGLAQVLAEGIDEFSPQEAQGFAQKIFDTGLRASTLLDQLLDWARSHQGKMPYEPTELSLSALAQENCDLFSETAQVKGITLVNLVPMGLKAFADKKSMSVVIRNLLGNALKFTHSGGLVELGGDVIGSRAHFWVKDTGRGMEPDQLERIFRLDLHSSTEGTAGEKGTGLGLILAQEFLENNQAQITVKSTPGKGSVFTFDLPLNPF